ncbi:MAG: lamin tail domain-containing protein, partial [Kiritimatiellae bacterium]|nr:lamin tail domain-containing protein [Kiritimatiellia bacterium]
MQQAYRQRQIVALLAAGILIPLIWAEAEVLVAKASTWRRAKGTREASDPRRAWREPDFDDSGWPNAQAPIGYGAAGLNTTFSDMPNTYSSFFIRRTFSVSAMDPDLRLRADVTYDDGFIMWINGERVLDRNEPDGAPTCDAFASESTAQPTNRVFALPDPEDYLELGENVLAVQVFNSSLTSSDCKIDVELSSYKRVADTTFSVDRGFYDASFTVTIATDTPGATIRYTTDGSPPSASHGAAAGAGVAVPITRTTCLRAAAFKGDYEPTDVDTHTYIFLDDVIHQTRPSGYPSYWINRDGESWKGDYEMDPDVVNDARYSGTIKNDLKSIPTLSLVCDKNDLFDRYQGIYTNPGRDANWEREERGISAEWLHPDGSEGFQIDCGLMMGGASPPGETGSPGGKKNMSLRFRSEYGPGRLQYGKLFEHTAVDRFNSLTLRSGGNDSYALHPTRAQFLRDQWARDTARDAGWEEADGRYVHLYLNGLYWGLYNVAERPDASFAAEHFGGDEDDFDAVNGTGANTTWWPLPWRILDGDSQAWDQLLARRDTDLADDANYQAMQDSLDIAPFIDWHLIRFFAEDYDWDYWAGWKRSKNFRATRKSRNRLPGDPAWRFHMWDVEHAMQIVKFENTSYYVADWTGSPGLWNIHGRLLANTDYRVRLADRIYKHLVADGGALTPAACRARYLARANEIERAVVGESARWGDTEAWGITHAAARDDWNAYFAANGGNASNYHPRTLDDEWVPERERLLNGFLSNGAAKLLGLFKARGQYPTLEPPSFSQTAGAISAGFRLTMSTSTGYAVYYTTDGSDPRVFGGANRGAVHATAQRYSGPVTLSCTTHVKARVYKTNGTWSAVHEATFNYTAHYAKIRITEILYNPLGGQEYEFVEIRNTGTSTRGLSGMTFKGVQYTFAPGAELAPGSFAVLVRNEAAFTSRHPGVKSAAAIFGVYRGALDNGGERCALLDSEGETVTSVKYGDNAPWPKTADGDGFSLVPLSTDGDQDDPAKWRASNLIGGSPGYDDGESYRVLVNEVLSHTDPPARDAIELYNAGAAAVDIGGWYLSDSAVAYKKFRIPNGTVLAPGAYAVFDETDFNANTNDPACFALSSHGDDVYLTRWDAAGNLLYLDGVQFEAAANGVAFGRFIKTDGGADFEAQSAANTLGGANAYPNVGPVVINEVMYHAGGGAAYDYVELLNITGSSQTLCNGAYGWRLAGTGYAFPAGTVIGPHEHILLIATNATAFRQCYPNVPAGARLFGPYPGRLQNNGERLRLERPDDPDEAGVPWILIDRVSYGDNAPWPESPDGRGPSLERIAPSLYGNDEANWSASAAPGGTPGAPNSGVLVPKTAGWTYHDRGENLGTAWRAVGYDDTGWQDGNAPLGYADPGAYPEIDTVVSYGENAAAKPITTYFRKAFLFDQSPASVSNFTLRARYDDGFVAYLNGQEILRAAMPGGTVTYTTAASGHGADGYETFDLTAHAANLRAGLNVLAVELHQAGPSSSDIFLDTELTCAAGGQEQPPAAPSDAAAVAVSASRIDVTWRDNSDNEDGFKIDRRQSGTDTWIRIATLTADQTALNDIDLPTETKFYYIIKAYNTTGDSAYSATADATTPAGTQSVPAQPSGVSATALSGTEIQITWQDNSDNETQFKIRRSLDGVDWYVLDPVFPAANATSYTDSDLTPGTPYYYIMRAENAAGVSAYTDPPVSAATPADAA